MKMKLKNIVPLLVALGTLTASSGAQDLKMRGFLDDYSGLTSDEETEARLLYIQPNTDFAKYTKVIIDPVTIWRSDDSKIKDIPRKDLDRLGQYFYEAIRSRLSGDYEIVNTIESDTLRVRVAITELGKSKVVLDTISSIAPPALAVGAIKKLTTGTHAFVGEAAMEGELLDASTGERLAAVVQLRSGGKRIGGALTGKGGSLADAQNAIDAWAERLRERLAELRTK